MESTSDFILKICAGRISLIPPSLTVVGTDCGQPQTGGGDVLKEQKCAAVGPDRAGLGWAAGRAAVDAVHARCADPPAAARFTV